MSVLSGRLERCEALQKGWTSSRKVPGIDLFLSLLGMGVPFHPKQSSSVRLIEYRRNDSAWFLRSKEGMWFPLGFLSWITPSGRSHHNRILGQPYKDIHAARNWGLCQQPVGESVSRQSSWLIQAFRALQLKLTSSEGQQSQKHKAWHAQTPATQEFWERGEVRCCFKELSLGITDLPCLKK